MATDGDDGVIRRRAAILNDLSTRRHRHNINFRPPTSSNDVIINMAAGNSEKLVLELHGTNRLVACLSCDYSEPPARAFEEFRQTREPPQCPQCQGWLKPATISFGQSLPEGLLMRAFELSQQADLVLSLGSTLAVEPAASIPRLAAAEGAPYIVINRGSTAHDHLATVRIEGDLVDLLPECFRV